MATPTARHFKDVPALLAAHGFPPPTHAQGARGWKGIVEALLGEVVKDLAEQFGYGPAAKDERCGRDEAIESKIWNDARLQPHWQASLFAVTMNFLKTKATSLKSTQKRFAGEKHPARGVTVSDEEEPRRPSAKRRKQRGRTDDSGTESSASRKRKLSDGTDSEVSTSPSKRHRRPDQEPVNDTLPPGLPSIEDKAAFDVTVITIGKDGQRGAGSLVNIPRHPALTLSALTAKLRVKGNCRALFTHDASPLMLAAQTGGTDPPLDLEDDDTCAHF